MHWTWSSIVRRGELTRGAATHAERGRGGDGGGRDHGESGEGCWAERVRSSNGRRRARGDAWTELAAVAFMAATACMHREWGSRWRRASGVLRNRRRKVRRARDTRRTGRREPEEVATRACRGSSNGGRAPAVCARGGEAGRKWRVRERTEPRWRPGSRGGAVGGRSVTRRAARTSPAT